jgi:hypothetical protein
MLKTRSRLDRAGARCDAALSASIFPRPEPSERGTAWDNAGRRRRIARLVLGSARRRRQTGCPASARSHRVSISFCAERAWRLSLYEIREKALASIAAMAICIAASAAVASMPVMNLSSALRRRASAFRRAFPLARSTLARHFPGSRSKALTTNCLYSMATPRHP